MKDSDGRECCVDVHPQGQFYAANVIAGTVILKQTHIHMTPGGAKGEADAWLEAYLETGSWNEATARVEGRRS